MTLEEDKKLIRTSIIMAIMIVFLPWAIKALEVGLDDRFSNLGIYPRKIVGLLGILTHWLVHGDFNHLLSNTFPFFMGLALLFYHYRKISFEVIVYLSLTTGLWVWIMGRSGTVHIGASGLVYAILSFLIFSGIISKNKRLMAVGLIVIFLHGGLIYGLVYGFFKEGISYEAHLSGFLAGILYAYWFKAKLIPEVKIKKSNIGQIYVDQYWQEQNNTIDQAVNFEYTFIEKEDPQD